MGLLDVLKFLTQATVNELVWKKTNGIFSSYEELKEWNELKKSLKLDDKKDDDFFNLF